MQPCHHVFQDRKVGEKPYGLESPGYTKLCYLMGAKAHKIAAIEADFPLIRGEDPGYEVKDCGFTSPVWAYHAQNFSFVHMEAYIIYSYKSAEAFG